MKLITISWSLTDNCQYPTHIHSTAKFGNMCHSCQLGKKRNSEEAHSTILMPPTLQWPKIRPTGATVSLPRSRPGTFTAHQIARDSGAQKPSPEAQPLSSSHQPASVKGSVPPALISSLLKQAQWSLTLWNLQAITFCLQDCKLP